MNVGRIPTQFVRTPGGSFTFSLLDSVDMDDAADSTDDRGRPCPVCETAMERRHCKYVCPRHGVVYDCSDTFW